MKPEKQWKVFALEAHENMTRFMNHDLEYSEACEFTDKYRKSNIVDGEILSFITNVMSNIVPSEELFETVRRMLGKPVTEQEFLGYMNSP